MEDYRMSVYLGAGIQGKELKDKIKTYAANVEFNQSEMQFVRYCIKFTVDNDPLVKTIDKRNKKAIG